MAFVLDLQSICDQSPVHRRLGLRVASGEEGLVIRADLGSEVANSAEGKVVHGGLAATVLDAAATLCLVAASGSDWVTVDLRVDYLSPLPVGPVEAGAEVLSCGRTIGHARAWIGARGEPQAAIASATFRRGAPLPGPDRD